MLEVYADMELDRSHAAPEPEPWSAYLDIETATRPEVLAAGALRTPAGELATWLEKHAADGARSALTGGVVAWAVVDSRGAETVSVLEDGERELLARLEERLRGAARIFTFNGATFDVPFLRARALAVGVPELARLLWQGKPWEGRLVDASSPDWCPRPPGPGGQRGWTLDAAARLFGVLRPVTIPGEQVPAAFYAGRLDEIRAHVLDDVRTLRALVQLWAQGRPE